MGQLTIRNIDDALLVQLKRKAWQEGIPLERFVRQLLAAGVETEDFDVPYMPSAAAYFAAKTDGAMRRMFHA